MAAVKRTICVIAIAATISGCSETQLSRFAPPGIIKYENIASEKPPNPAIEETVRNRKANSNAVYPVIARTPGLSDRPEKPSTDLIEAEMSELVEARETLNALVEADRAAAAEDAQERESLSRDSESFKRQLDRDAKAANAERRRPIQNPDE